MIAKQQQMKRELLDRVRESINLASMIIELGYDIECMSEPPDQQLNANVGELARLVERIAQ